MQISAKNIREITNNRAGDGRSFACRAERDRHSGSVRGFVVASHHAARADAAVARARGADDLHEPRRACAGRCIDLPYK